MSQPVWVLSVDLQAKTASFTTGLADAARQARSSMKEISSGASEMGEGVGRGSLDVRHALGLVDNTIRGAHSMAMVDMIRMFKDSAIVMQGLPFAMVVAGIGLIGEMAYSAVEKYRAMQEATEKLANAHQQLSTSIRDVFNGLDVKIIEAQKQTDELNKNHLAVLHDELQIIDHTSMEDLRHSFETIAKETDALFAELKAHWYEYGTGAAGAQHALEQFKAQYNAMLANNNATGADGLLHGTLSQAQQVLNLLQQAQQGFSGKDAGKPGSYNEVENAKNSLRQLGVKLENDTAGSLARQVDSQQALVNALQAQVTVEGKVAELKKIQTGGAVATAHNAANEDAAKAMEAEARIEREFAQNFRQYEQDRIDATQEGSAERLAVLRSAMDDAASLYGMDSEQYTKYSNELLKTQRDVDRQLLEADDAYQKEMGHQREEAAREAAASSEKMGMIALAAYKEQIKAQEAARHASDALRLSDALRVADMEYEIKRAALERETAALDKDGKDYQNRLKALQDKEKQLTQQHESEITAIKEKAEAQRAQTVLAAERNLQDSLARGLSLSITGHQTWSKMLLSLGDEVATGMMENAIKSVLANDYTKESDAASAARSAFKAGMKLPFPINLVAAPVLAAGAFAAVMAYESGTDRVPGVGRGDVVPSMLAPGEGVVPGGVMDNLRTMSRNGGFDQRPAPVIHFRPTYHVQTIDGDGWGKALEKHADQTQRHFENAVRRMNR